MADGKCHFTPERHDIQRAAENNDWKSAKEKFNQEPDLMTEHITCWMETALIVAVKNKSNDFVKELVEAIMIVSKGSADRLFVSNSDGNNPLHYAAKVGNTFAARLLVKHKPEMIHVPNNSRNTPLHLAAWHGKKDTLECMVKVITPDLIREEEGSSLYTGVSGGYLITLIINAEFVGKSRVFFYLLFIIIIIIIIFFDNYYSQLIVL